ncbi:MAG: UMP kinase [Patescibacteria group bacterium]
MNETIIISLGGSLIVPDAIDIEFLKDFKSLILSEVEKGKRFVIITGGGKIARRYIDVAKDLVTPPDEDLDFIGIAALRLNAELLRVVFGNQAYSKVISDLSGDLSFQESIIIGSAYEPGHSTDWDAVLAAKNKKAKKIVNLSNVNYVYDSDPNKNPHAKKIEKISWEEYKKIIPGSWTSGLNSPFDPTASEEAEEAGIEVVIMNGKPLDNFANYLAGKSFQGTVIS